MPKTTTKTRSSKNATRGRAKAKPQKPKAAMMLKPKAKAASGPKPKTASGPKPKAAMAEKRVAATNRGSSAKAKPAKARMRPAKTERTPVAAQPRPIPADVPSYQELPVREGAPAGAAWGVFGDDDQVG